MAAARALLEVRADPHSTAADGASPLTAAIQIGNPFAPLLVHYAAQAAPSLVRAVGLSMSPPWMNGPIDWEVLRNLRAFDLILWNAERMAVANPRNPWASAVQGSFPGAASSRDSARLGALSDMLCHGVSRRFLAMTTRVLAVLPPLNGRAGLAEALLLEQMLRLASADARWFSVAQAQLRRGAAAGNQAWRGGHRVLGTLADLAAQGQPHSQEMLLEAALGKEWASSCDEPRVLFPELAAECSVCFEPLYQNDPTFFVNDNKRRSCVHYVCGACAVTCLPTKECPMCRASISDCVALPPLDIDPRAWFRHAGCEPGRLDPAELCHAVAACLPVSEERLLRAIELEDGPWKRCWDRNSDGTITEDDFFAPHTGLFAWILAHLQELHRAERRSTAFLPDLRTDPAAWFEFWADRGTGSLTFGEVLRGIFSSRRLTALEDRNQLHSVRKEVKGLWRSAGVQAESVTKAEFLRPGGLGALLGASLEQAGIPRGQVSIAKLPPSPVLKPSSPNKEFRDVAPPRVSLPPEALPERSMMSNSNPFLPQGRGQLGFRDAELGSRSARELRWPDASPAAGRSPKTNSRQLLGDAGSSRSPKPSPKLTNRELDFAPGRSPTTSSRPLGGFDGTPASRTPTASFRQTGPGDTTSGSRMGAFSAPAPAHAGRLPGVVGHVFGAPQSTPMSGNRPGADPGDATADAIARATSGAPFGNPFTSRSSAQTEMRRAPEPNLSMDTLVAMGFPPDKASRALRESSGDVERAVGVLLSGM